ncbi:MAG: hypothetical protein U1F27_00600 [Turneriella sp.]
MRYLLTYSLRLLPAALAFPVALAAAPLCGDCPALKPVPVEKNTHACCDKTQKLTQAESTGVCNSCCLQTTTSLPSEKLKGDLAFVAIGLPASPIGSIFLHSSFLSQRLSFQPPSPTGAVFITQLKILI